MACSLLITGTGCGYRPAVAAGSDYPLAVVAAPFKTPHPDALEATLAGLRAGLSEGGALGPGHGFPQVVVELLRVDELPAGIAAAATGAGSLPLARASAVGVTARAWVVDSRGGAPRNDTGDVRRVEYAAQGADSLGSGYAYAAAVRAAARRVGEALARRILGIPEAGSDPM